MLSDLRHADIRLLRTFLAVCDTGGLSAAQPRLNRSLGSISADIRELEIRLGEKVCTRGRGGFSLTEHGRQLYESSQRLFEHLDLFVAEWRDSPMTLTGALRIAVNEGQISDPSFVLSAAIARYMGRPNNRVKVGLHMAAFERVEEMLLRGEIEIGFGYFDRMVRGLELTPLFNERNHVYCGRDHPLFAMSDSRISGDLVRTYPFVFRPHLTRGMYGVALDGVAAAGTGTTPESRAYMILSGRYLGYLAEHHAEPWVRADLLRPLRPDLLSLDFLFQMALKQATKKTREVTVFLDDYFAVVKERGGDPSAGAG